MSLIFCCINIQHAPSLVQSSRVEPTKFASRKIQFTRGGIKMYSKYIPSIVSKELNKLENRFFLSHHITHNSITGGLISLLVILIYLSPSTFINLLNKFIIKDVNKLKNRYTPITIQIISIA